MGEGECRFEKKRAYKVWAAASKDNIGIAVRAFSQTTPRLPLLRVCEVFQNELMKK